MPFDGPVRCHPCTAPLVTASPDISTLAADRTFLSGCNINSRREPADRRQPAFAAGGVVRRRAAPPARRQSEPPLDAGVSSAPLDEPEVQELGHGAADRGLADAELTRDVSLLEPPPLGPAEPVRERIQYMQGGEAFDASTDRRVLSQVIIHRSS